MVLEEKKKSIIKGTNNIDLYKNEFNKRNSF